jgi:PEP-CTERM motif
MVRKILLAGFLAGSAMAAATMPAHAVLQIAFSNGASTFNCADGQACDNSLLPNLLQLNSVTVGSFTLTGTFAQSKTLPTDELTVSSLTVTTTTGGTLDMAIGATGFVGPVTVVQVSGSGTFIDTLGGSGALSFAADTTNTQGADTSTDLPGTNIGTFPFSVTLDPDSISGSTSRAFSAAGLFSMTEGAAFTINPGGEIVGFNEAMNAVVPEPSTWAMMLIGFAGLAYVGYRASRRTAAAT